MEDKFEDGMSWENHGEWQIDHKIPCSAFDLTNENHAKICFNYRNLQPLWKKDNIKKGDKYSKRDLQKLRKKVLNI